MTSPLQIEAPTLLTPGDPAPTLIQRSITNPRFALDTAAGRYLVLCFFGSAADPHAQAALQTAYDKPDIFDDHLASFFGVSVAPEDEANGRVTIHQFRVTRMERFIVSCYAAADSGHFSAHRDNTTKGTAHRRFGVSVNLNDDFDGGDASFAEYGPRSFKAPPGGAVVFSCLLLHKVGKVTRGQRYAFLPFLYDDAAARIREENAQYLGETGSSYRAGTQVPRENTA